MLISACSLSYGVGMIKKNRDFFHGNGLKTCREKSLAYTDPERCRACSPNYNVLAQFTCLCQCLQAICVECDRLLRPQRFCLVQQVCLKTTFVIFCNHHISKIWSSFDTVLFAKIKSLFKDQVFNTSKRIRKGRCSIFPKRLSGMPTSMETTFV